MSIRSRIISFLKFSILNRFIIFFNQYFRHSLFINFLGLEMYGVWIFLMTIPSYLTLSDFGISDTAENHINLNLNKISNIEISKIFWCSLNIAFTIFFVIFIFCNFFLDNLINNFSKLYPITNESNTYFFNLIFFYSFLIIITKKFQSLIVANQHYNFLINLRSFSIVFELCIIFSIFSYNLSLDKLLISFIFIRILLLLVTIFKFYSYGIISFRFSYLGFSNFKGLYRPSLVFVLAPLINLIRLQGVVFLIINFFSANLVSIYSVSSTLIRSTSIFIHLISGPINIEIAKLFSKLAFKQISNIINIQISFYFWISCFFYPLLFIFADDFFYFWLNKENIFLIDYFILLIVSNLFFLINSPYNSFILSINLHINYILISILIALISLFIFFLLLSNEFMINPLYLVLIIDFLSYLVAIYCVNNIIKIDNILNSFNPFNLFKIYIIIRNQLFKNNK